MPIPKGARTSAKITEDIDVLVEEKDKRSRSVKAKLRVLTQEFNEAVAQEAARAKFDSMSDEEKQEFARLLAVEGVEA